MNALVTIGAIGAGVWAYKNGHLDGLVERFAAMTGQGVEAEPAPAPVAFNVPSVPLPAPVVEAAFVAGGTTQELNYLETYWGSVQPWARRNKEWVSCLMSAESAGNTNAISPDGARGLLQVMDGTMGDLVRWGWDRYPHVHRSLHTPAIGIYFGTAYMEYLYRNWSQDRDTITRMYNAGPGGKRSDGTWPLETRNYLSTITQKYEDLTT